MNEFQLADENPTYRPHESFEESFPNSEKVYKEVWHDERVLRIPERRIHLDGGSGQIDVYDTTGL